MKRERLMHMSSLGRWVVRVSVVAALGIAALSAAHRYTPNDVIWTANVVSTVPAGR
jgi:hypothetical protein